MLPISWTIGLSKQACDPLASSSAFVCLKTITVPLLAMQGQSLGFLATESMVDGLSENDHRASTCHARAEPRVLATESMVEGLSENDHRASTCHAGQSLGVWRQNPWWRTCLKTITVPLLAESTQMHPGMTFSVSA
jgi:hypothetical protein